MLGVFQEAKNIFIYQSIAGEVDTIEFINKWMKSKLFYLPVVQNNNLLFRKFTEKTEFIRSQFGIMEPNGLDFSEFHKVDLIIVPGVAFDRNKNRLGYGKGFYDKFLLNLKIPKIGICFEFQLLDKIPTNHQDIKMDYIVSENDLIW